MPKRGKAKAKAQDARRDLERRMLRQFKADQARALREFDRFWGGQLKSDYEHDVPAKTRGAMKRNAGLRLYLEQRDGDPDAWKRHLDGLLKGVAEFHAKPEFDLSKIKTREDLARWWMEVYVPNGPMRQSVFSEASSMQYKFFERTRTSGYLVTTMQAIVMADMHNLNGELEPEGQGVPFDAERTADLLLDELGVWLPLVRPIPEDPKPKKGDEGAGKWAGWKYVDVMEPALSKGGCHGLMIRGEVAAHVLSRYRRESEIARGPVREVILGMLRGFARHEDRDDDD